jgi:hypothetical protein
MKNLKNAERHTKQGGNFDGRYFVYRSRNS